MSSTNSLPSSLPPQLSPSSLSSSPSLSTSSSLLTSVSFSSLSHSLSNSYSNGRLANLVAKTTDSPNDIVYRKMEQLLSKMQFCGSGVPIRNVKILLTKVHSVFSGTDLISWMQKNLDVQDTQETTHLAQMMTFYGYIFAIDNHALLFKNDNTYYRFQTPCFWPSMHSDPEDTDYAVYLCKRTMQGKQRLELADYEAETLARLQKKFARQWEFICMQADSQAKLDKKREKADRQVLDSQERAFWDVYRPAPGCVNTTEVDIKKTCRSLCRRPKNFNKPTYSVFGGSISPNIFEKESEPFEKTIEELNLEIQDLKNCLDRSRIKVSKVAKSLLIYQNNYGEFDLLTSAPDSSNPWICDSPDLWEEEASLHEVSQKRTKKWALSIQDLLKDVAGRSHFLQFLEKEFSAENLKFYESCQRLHSDSKSHLKQFINHIYEEYLSTTAKSPVNIDCKVAESVKKKMTENEENRFCFEDAEEQILRLMKNDSYNRYIRSDAYKDFMLNAKKKHSKKKFPTDVRRFKELTTSKSQPNVTLES